MSAQLAAWQSPGPAKFSGWHTQQVCAQHARGATACTLEEYVDEAAEIGGDPDVHLNLPDCKANEEGPHAADDITRDVALYHLVVDQLPPLVLRQPRHIEGPLRSTGSPRAGCKRSCEL